jgi:pimeloyl-ACP methyl ester carboxylesterase
MPTAVVDGIETSYELQGDGPPVLMFSPGGFGAARQNWRALGVYARLGLIEALSRHYTCISFDRREAGESGGRLERVGWRDYVGQGMGLLDYLKIERAVLMGGCIGCSIALGAAVEAPHRATALVLYSPAGGAHYRLGQHRRFTRHLGYVEENGLDGVVELARNTEVGFSKDPRVGPWVTILRNDEDFAAEYAATDPDRYYTIVSGMARLQFDRDSVPGIEPEDLLTLDVPALVVPGEDRSHAPSAARFLEECLPNASFWDVGVAEQTAQSAPERILEFLADHHPA